MIKYEILKILDIIDRVFSFSNNSSSLKFVKIIYMNIQYIRHEMIFSELEISAVVHINTNNTNNNNHLEILEKRKSFADMKTVQVTNTNLQTIEVGGGFGKIYCVTETRKLNISLHQRGNLFI